MAAKTLGKVKSSFQELLDFSKKELSTGRGEFKDDLLTFAKRTTTIVRGQSVPEQSLSSAVNPEVGGLILLHFLILHGRIHEEATACFQKAAETDAVLQAIAKVTVAWRREMEACDIEFGMLPDLVKSVQNAREKISSINCQLHGIHQDLYQLEVLNAKLDNERKKNSLLLQLKMHRTSQESSLGLLRDKVSIKELELALLKSRVAEQAASERQEAFQEMFAEDCQQFRSSGRLEREVSFTSSTKSLEEVEVVDEEGKKSLDEFLEDVPLSPPPTPTSPPTTDTLDPNTDILESSPDIEEPSSTQESSSNAKQLLPSDQDPPSSPEEPSSDARESSSELAVEPDL